MYLYLIGLLSFIMLLIIVYKSVKREIDLNTGLSSLAAIISILCAMYGNDEIHKTQKPNWLFHFEDTSSTGVPGDYLFLDAINNNSESSNLALTEIRVITPPQLNEGEPLVFTDFGIKRELEGYLFLPLKESIRDKFNVDTIFTLDIPFYVEANYQQYREEAIDKMIYKLKVRVNHRINLDTSNKKLPTLELNDFKIELPEAEQGKLKHLYTEWVEKKIKGKEKN